MSVALLPAVEQLSLLRSGSLNSLELAHEHLRRIERLNPQLNAFVDFQPERVLAQARAPLPGPLSGLPITIKSSIEVAGHRCEIGSTLRRGTLATHDATAVAQLRAAGAIILGTTNCPEFLMAYDTANLLNGPTRNPWDLSRSAGGSSGGESAAIAAGLSAAGLGSDSGGSVRLPAHFTGICSLKPTPGRISAGGHQPPCVGPFSTLGALGPMARTIADVRLLFNVLDQKPCPQPSSAPLTIAWFDDEEHGPITPKTRAALSTAAEHLQQHGYQLQRLHPAGLDEARRLWRIFFLQCGALFYESTIRGQHPQLSPIFREFLDEAAVDPPLTAATLLQAWADMDLLRERFWQQLPGVSLLLTPVCSVPAFLHGERNWATANQSIANQSIANQTVNYWDAMRFTQWFNLLASPAATIPIAHQPLPISVQLAGPPGTDEIVLTAAAILDQAFGYRIPPLANLTPESPAPPRS